MKCRSLLLLTLLTGYAWGQSKPDCIRIRRAAESALEKGVLRDALVKLRALKVCDPSLNAFVDNKILEVYDSIRTQKERAEEAQHRAEVASEAERKAKELARSEQRKAEASALAERKAKEEAERQTAVAEARLTTMVSRKLSSVGLGIQGGIDPEWHLSLLLGMEAMSLSYSPEADHVIRNAMDHLPVLIKEPAATDTGSPAGPCCSIKNGIGHTSIREIKTDKVIFSMPSTFGPDFFYIADGTKLLLGSETNKVYIIQLPEGKVLDSLVHKQRIVGLWALSDDQRYLLTQDYNMGENRTLDDGLDEVWIWDLHSGKVIQNFSPGSSLSRTLNQLPRFKRIGDQQFLVIGHEIWEIGAGKSKTPKTIPGLLTYDGNFMLVKIPDNRGFSFHGFPDTTFLFKGDLEVHNFCTSLNGRYLALSNGHSFEMWDIKDRKKLYEKPPHSEDEPSRLAADYVMFSDNGKYFSFGGSTCVYDTYTGKKVFKNFWSEVTDSVQVSYNGTGGLVPVHQLIRRDPAYCSGFSSTGDTMYTYTNSGLYQMWRIVPGSAAAIATMPGYGTDLYSAADGSQYMSDHKGIYKFNKSRPLDTLRQIRRSVYALAVNENAGLLAYGGDAELMVPEGIGVGTINLSSNEAGFIPLRATIRTIDLNSTGKLALVGTSANMTTNEEQGLWVLDLVSKTKKKVDSSQRTYYKAFFWKSDNKILFAGGNDIVLKDLANDSIIFNELYTNTQSLAIDRDFKHIALGDKERVSVYTMDNDDRTSDPATKSFNGEVVTTAFSASGDYLIIGLKTKNFKGEVVIWNLKDNSIALQIVTSLPVTRVVFDGSGPGNIIVMEGPHVKVYEWQSDALLKRAAQRVLRPLTKEEWDTYVGNEFPFRMKTK
jgi:hypothetical protein